MIRTSDLTDFLGWTAAAVVSSILMGHVSGWPDTVLIILCAVFGWKAGGSLQFVVRQ